MKRLVDIVISFIALSFLLIPLLLLSICIFLTSNGHVIYWSQRVGKDNHIFILPKFRSMHVNTPAVATDLLKNPDLYLTPIGSFLRKNSLDELPQLWSVLKGDMSIVGPRPSLFNQYDLISLRTKYNINTLLPGVTGWAQINGRDNLSIEEKVKLDLEYLQRRSLYFDLKIILMTFFKVFKKEGVSH